MAYMRLNGLNGLGALAGKAAQKATATDMAAFTEIKTKLLPDISSTYNKIRSNISQLAGAANAAISAVQAAEAEAYGGSFDSFSFSESGGSADIEDAMSEAQSLGEKAQNLASEIKDIQVPDAYAPLPTSDPLGAWFSGGIEKFRNVLAELKALAPKVTALGRRVATATQMAQRQVAQAQQRRTAEENRVRAQQAAEEKRQRDLELAEQRRVDAEQRKEDARQQAELKAEERRLQTELQAEQRRMQMEAQRAQMEAQAEAQRAAIEQAKQAAEMASLYPPVVTQPAPVPGYDGQGYTYAPGYGPGYNTPVTTTTDAGYVDPSAVFSQLLPPTPQAYNVPQEALYQTTAGSDWIDAESKAGGWNSGGGSLWGMRGLGATPPKATGTGGATAAPKGTTPTPVEGRAAVTGNTGLSRRAPRPAPEEAPRSSIFSLRNLAIAAAAYFVAKKSGVL